MLNIKSMRALGWKLKIHPNILQSVAAKIDSSYRPAMIRKRDGSPRHLNVPNERLKAIQKQIHRLLKDLPWPEHIHGGIPGRSPTTMASAHLGQPVVVRIDIKNFFPSVDHKMVHRIWREQLGCSPDIARLLTRLTTNRRCLPQGAPTSCDLANLALSEADLSISKAAESARMRYDRYIDDPIFSGASLGHLITETIVILRSAGFHVKRRKIQVMRHGSRQEVLGYNVNRTNGLSIARSSRDRVRAAIHQSQSSKENRELAEASLRGRILHMRGPNPGSYRRCLLQLSQSA